METILLIEIILWGACLLIVLHFIGGLIVASLVEKNILHFFAIVFILLLLGFVPAWGFYVCLNKYLKEPEPVNLTETCIDGEMRIIYQDTTHFCPSSHDEHSSTFTSYLSPIGKVSQKDICIHCLKPFLFHNTPEEDRFCNAIAFGVEAYNNSLTVNETKTGDTRAFYGINGFRPFYVNNRKLWVLHQKPICSYVFCNFAFQDK